MAFKRNYKGLEHRISLIDGTVLGAAQPENLEKQHANYNAKKRKMSAIFRPSIKLTGSVFTHTAL